jgi:hypothetical protein
MGYRRSDFDVTDRVRTTDAGEVGAEVCRIFQDLYQADTHTVLQQAFGDLERLYRGEERHYHGCETEYHDIQHVLDVTLAMARLMNGYVRATNSTRLPGHLFTLGIVTALFHDVGYIRHRHDHRHRHGAEYTRIHVSRGGRFLLRYLEGIGMADLALPASRIVHFTGYEMPIAEIDVNPEHRTIGNLLGSADLLAQMADRCYLEKCYERLYPEFLCGGLTRKFAPDGSVQVIYESAADLVFKTAGFCRSAHSRLENDLQQHYVHAARHFDGDNLYWDEFRKNVRHAEIVAAKRDLSLLRRQPPVTFVGQE